MIIFVTKSWLERKKKGKGKEGRRERRRKKEKKERERERRWGGREGREGRKEGRASSELSPSLLECWCVITVVSNMLFFST